MGSICSFGESLDHMQAKVDIDNGKTLSPKRMPITRKTSVKELAEDNPSNKAKSMDELEKENKNNPNESCPKIKVDDYQIQQEDSTRPFRTDYHSEKNLWQTSDGKQSQHSEKEKHSPTCSPLAISEIVENKKPSITISSNILGSRKKNKIKRAATFTQLNKFTDQTLGSRTSINSFSKMFAFQAYDIMTPTNNHSFKEREHLKILYPYNKELVDYKFIVDCFCKLPFLKGLETKEALWKSIVRDMSFCSVEPNRIFIKQGTSGEYFFIVKQGSVILHLNKKKQIKLNAPFCLGEISLFGNSERTCSVESETMVFAYVLHKNKFDKILNYLRKTTVYDDFKMYIDKCYILSLFPQDIKDRLILKSLKETFDPGMAIIRENENINSIKILICGEAIIKSRSAESLLSNNINNYNLIYTSAKVLPGELLGYRNIIIPGLTDYSITASQTCICISFPFHAFKDVFGKEGYQRTFQNYFIKQLLLHDIWFSKIANAFDMDILNTFQIETLNKHDIILPAGSNFNNNFLIILDGDYYAETSPKFTTKFSFGEIISTEAFYTNASKICEINIKVLNKCTVVRSTREIMEQLLGGTFEEMCVILQKMEFCRNIKGMDVLQDSDLRKLCKEMTRENFTYGELVYEAGDAASKVYIITQGEVILTSKSTKDGSIIMQNGHIFGLEAINEIIFSQKSKLSKNYHSSRMHSAHAKTKIECYSIDSNVLINYFNGNNNFRNWMFQRILYQENILTIKTMEVSLLPYWNYSNPSQSKPFIALNRNSRLKYFIKLYGKEILYENNNIFKSKREMKELLNKIDHPFIVKLLQVEKDMNFIYMIYEYIQGISLDMILRKITKCSIAFAKFCSACILLSLQYLHSKRIIYRSLKPSNIIIQHSGYPKLIHFSLAKSLAIDGKTFSVKGTPHYMAPEQLLPNLGYSYCVDLWALGVVIYEIVCSRVPFGMDTNDPMEIYTSIINEELVFSKEVNDENLIKLLTSILEKPIETRLKNITAILDHPFYQDIDFEQLGKMNVAPSFIPSIDNKYIESLDFIPFQSILNTYGVKVTPKNPNMMPNHNWDDNF